MVINCVLFSKINLPIFEYGNVHYARVEAVAVKVEETHQLARRSHVTHLGVHDSLHSEIVHVGYDQDHSAV